jgi:hypothetical protein
VFSPLPPPSPRLPDGTTATHSLTQLEVSLGWERGRHAAACEREGRKRRKPEEEGGRGPLPSKNRPLSLSRARARAPAARPMKLRPRRARRVSAGAARSRGAGRGARPRQRDSSSSVVSGVDGGRARKKKSARLAAVAGEQQQPHTRTHALARTPWSCLSWRPVHVLPLVCFPAAKDRRAHLSPSMHAGRGAAAARARRLFFSRLRSSGLARPRGAEREVAAASLAAGRSAPSPPPRLPRVRPESSACSARWADRKPFLIIRSRRRPPAPAPAHRNSTTPTNRMRLRLARGNSKRCTLLTTAPQALTHTACRGRHVGHCRIG